MHVSRLCSCYAPSNSNKGTPGDKSRNRSYNKKHRHVIIKDDEHVHRGKINGVGSESRSKMYGADQRGIGIPIKSNFKRTLVQEDAYRISSGIRKVTWSDAYGKSIAHVQEFEPR
ncbi:putative light-harvesting complex-like protein OHP2 [Helianthus anomalus]